MKKKTAIVTGGAQGIGKAIAAGLVRNNFYVIIAEINEEAGKTAVEDLGENNSRFVACDVAKEQDVLHLFENMRENNDSLEVLVNNAGIIRDRPIWKLTVEEFDLVVQVNLRGTWLMCREAAKVFRETKYGRIINIASRAWLGNFGQTNYSASKAGVIGLSRSLALELAKYNTTVNVVAPGLIETPLTTNLPQSVQQQLIEAQPTKKMGSVEDISAMVAFLASKEAGFITGQIHHVDGGKSIGARVG